MRNVLYVTVLLFSLTLCGQHNNNYNDPYEEEVPDYGWKKRIAFIIGGGASHIVTELYDIPVVNKASDFVTIEKANRVKPNLSLGISYTPSIKSVVRQVQVMRNGNVEEETVIEYVPRGLTFSLFLNPLSLGGVSANSIANTVDIGFGIGWRSGDFSFLLTNEYFGVRQPRQYFIDLHQNNDTPYIIHGNIQSTIDTSDNNIFKNKIAVSWGIKIAYTFDVTRSFIF